MSTVAKGDLGVVTARISPSGLTIQPIPCRVAVPLESNPFTKLFAACGGKCKFDGKVGEAMPVDGGYAEQTLDEIRRQGVDIDALALKLQKEGGDSFVKSWNSLMGGLSEKVTKLTAISPS